MTKWAVQTQKRATSLWVTYVTYHSKDDLEGYTAEERARDKAHELMRRGGYFNARVRTDSVEEAAASLGRIADRYNPNVVVKGRWTQYPGRAWGFDTEGEALAQARRFNGEVSFNNGQWYVSKPGEPFKPHPWLARADAALDKTHMSKQRGGDPICGRSAGRSGLITTTFDRWMQLEPSERCEKCAQTKLGKMILSREGVNRGAAQNDSAQWNESDHPRGEAGKFGTGGGRGHHTSTTSSGQKVQWKEPKLAAGKLERGESQVVNIDPQKFDADWSKNRFSQNHVGKGGEGGIKKRYPEFGEWLKKGEDVEMSEPYINVWGEPDFINGRHRFAYMRDQGAKSIPVVVPTENVEDFKKRWGASEAKADDIKTWPIETPRKVCNNCGTVYGLNRRKCPQKWCGSKYWTAETPDQVSKRVEHSNKMEALLQSLIKSDAVLDVGDKVFVDSEGYVGPAYIREFVRDGAYVSKDRFGNSWFVKLRAIKSTRSDAAVSSTNQVVVYTEPGQENFRVNSIQAAKRAVSMLRERGFTKAFYMTAKERGVKLDAIIGMGTDLDLLLGNAERFYDATEMSATELKDKLLEMAQRRTIHASAEAKLLGVEVERIRRAIAELKANKLIYSSEKSNKNYWGGGESGYRAN